MKQARDKSEIIYLRSVNRRHKMFRRQLNHRRKSNKDLCQTSENYYLGVQGNWKLYLRVSQFSHLRGKSLNLTAKTLMKILC